MLKQTSTRLLPVNRDLLGYNSEIRKVWPLDRTITDHRREESSWGERTHLKNRKSIPTWTWPQDIFRWVVNVIINQTQEEVGVARKLSPSSAGRPQEACGVFQYWRGRGLALPVKQTVQRQGIWLGSKHRVSQPEVGESQPELSPHWLGMSGWRRVFPHTKPLATAVWASPSSPSLEMSFHEQKNIQRAKEVTQRCNCEGLYASLHSVSFARAAETCESLGSVLRTARFLSRVEWQAAQTALDRLWDFTSCFKASQLLF